MSEQVPFGVTEAFRSDMSEDEMHLAWTSMCRRMSGEAKKRGYVVIIPTVLFRAEPLGEWGCIVVATGRAVRP